MFNPAALTLAREAEGLTQVALAPKVGVSQAYVSQLEHGLKEPTDELLERLSGVLDRPREFFEDQSRLLGAGVVEWYHKKRLTLPAKPLRKAHALVNIARLEVSRLLRGVDLLDTQPLPALPIDEVGTPERAAMMMRRFMRAPAGPLGNLVAHVERMGVPVLILDLGHRKLSAISVPLEDSSHLIVLNEKLPSSDQRFALAHELAHLSMHGAIADVPDLEREADAFAGALLLPEHDARSELRQLRFNDLGQLKARWRVPMKALVYRAKEVGAIDDTQATQHYKRLSAMPGGPLREPGEFPAEDPRLVRAVLLHLRDDLGYSRSDLAQVMKTTERRLMFYLGEDPGPQLSLVPSDRPQVRID